VPGQNVVLSLDMKLQLAAQEAMQDMRGAVVAIDPRNGDVLALVSTPSFDPNRFAAGLSRADYNALTTDLDKPLYNRALAGVYPPGSTVKPFLALAALENEAMTPDEERYCPGHYRLPGQTHRYRDWRPQGHGDMDMRGAIVQSCDVYFYHLAVAMGIEAMADGLKQFGFGSPVGLDINGENSGVVPSREWKQKQFARREDQVWFPGETVITGIGQGYMLVTPIRIVVASLTSTEERAKLIDAVQARKEPGTLVHLEGDDVPAFLSIKISPHQLGVPDMLAAAKLKDVYPQRIVLWGVQPERMEIGLELSPTVESQVDIIIKNVLEQLQAWGHILIPNKMPV